MAKDLIVPEQPITITLAVRNNKIDVRVTYPHKWTNDDMKLSLFLERAIKEAFRNFNKTEQGTNKEGSIDV